MNKPIHQSTNPSNPSIDRAHQSLDPFVHPSLHQPINSSLYQSINLSIYRLINRLIHQSIQSLYRHSSVTIKTEILRNSKASCFCIAPVTQSQNGRYRNRKSILSAQGLADRTPTHTRLAVSSSLAYELTETPPQSSPTIHSPRPRDGIKPNATKHRLP